VAENFADDIPVQDAHDANGECSTVATTFALPRYPSFVLEAGERYFRSSKSSRERGEDSPGKPSALESADWRYAQILPVHEFLKMIADNSFNLRMRHSCLGILRFRWPTSRAPLNNSSKIREWPVKHLPGFGRQPLNCSVLAPQATYFLGGRRT
jgi:hypothetical protein